MSAGSAFQARGPATDSARSPILVRVRGMSKVRLSSERRCDRPDIADVSADVVRRIPVSSTIHQNTQFVLYALTDRKPDVVAE